MKILVVNDHDGLYSKFAEHLGETTTDVELLFQQPEEISLILFSGGADVSPSVYGHQNLHSHNDEARDDQEMEIFQKAQWSGIPMTGICRGSQFLNSMLGGTMVQHLRETHGGGQHNAIAYQNIEDQLGDPREHFEVTSSHHQMSVLGHEGVLLSWADKLVPITSLEWDGDSDELREALIVSGNYRDDGSCLVTEAFAYPGERVFSVQHHPEWQDLDCPAAQWTLNMIRKICLEEGEQVTAPRALVAR